MACGGREIVTETLSPDGKVISRVTEEKGFWASENLEAHYAAIGAQIEAVSTMHKTTQYETKTEAVLGSVIAMMLIEKISNSPAPRTAADLWAQNLVPLLQLGSGWIQFALQDWGDYNKSNSPNNHIQGDNNIVMFGSEVGTGQGNQADVYFGDYSPIDANVAGHATSLSLNTSRPYSYSNWEDNSRTTTNTTTRTSESNNIR